MLTCTFLRRSTNARVKPRWCPPQYCMYFVVRTRQHMYVAHDARFHTHNRVRGHVHPCIRACRHTKYKHACLPRTYAYFIPVQSAIVYIMYQHVLLCKQTMYCTHLSVWSVELWISAAAMCCAPSATMKLNPRLYAHVYMREERYSARA
jgi:hypothetical protein